MNDTREIDWTELLQAALTAPGSLGNTYSRFYDYSFLNQVWLLIQGVCEPVATYKRWQAIGRQVKRGSKAKSVLRPITLTRKNDDGEVVASWLRFKLVNCLFGYSETDGEPLPAVQTAGWDLSRALKELDVTEKPFADLSGNVQGYSLGRQYAISPVAVNPTRTLFHELGHILCGHTSGNDDGEHRGVREFQAESVAFLAMNELELIDDVTASRSRAYIQGWLGGRDVTDREIRKVFSATSALLKAGRGGASLPSD